MKIKKEVYFFIACLLLLCVEFRSSLFAQEKKQYPNWDAVQEGMIFLVGANEVTVDGVQFKNNGQIYNDSRGSIENLKNCYDLEAKKGPIFKEAKIIEGTLRERYFVFIANKQESGSLILKKMYLDEILHNDRGPEEE